ncbi:unnamed protein product, partial [Ectocarpus sp. 12 AP-2014]
LIDTGSSPHRGGHPQPFRGPRVGALPFLVAQELSLQRRHLLLQHPDDVRLRVIPCLGVLSVARRGGGRPGRAAKIPVAARPRHERPSLRCIRRAIALGQGSRGFACRGGGLQTDNNVGGTPQGRRRRRCCCRGRRRSRFQGES